MKSADDRARRRVAIEVRRVIDRAMRPGRLLDRDPQASSDTQLSRSPVWLSTAATAAVENNVENNLLILEQVQLCGQLCLFVRPAASRNVSDLRVVV